MKRHFFLMAFLFGWVGTILAQMTQTCGVERLGRGLTVIPTNTKKGEFISWRFLSTDDKNTSFDILRDGEVLVENLNNVTSYKDVAGTVDNCYQIVTKVNGVAVDTTSTVRPWKNPFYRLQLDMPEPGEDYTYGPGDCSVGDVDGDGEYELFVKWDPSNQRDNSQGGMTGNVLIDCYKIDWTMGGKGTTPERLWRIDLGVNIRAGAHYTQFMVYDFDGNGKAEMICKTAPGSIDGLGNYVSKAGTDHLIPYTDNTRDWRNDGGRVDGGYEFLTVFEGLTGKAIHTVLYKPNRHAASIGASEAAGTFNWDDRANRTDYTGYGNRGERYLAAVAHLDGINKPAYGIFSRGYYSFSFVWAVGFDGKRLKDKWFHASNSLMSYWVKNENGKRETFYPGPATCGNDGRTMFAQGNHNMSIGDVDGDGRDEVVWGSAALDDDGKLLYSTGWGHGDAIHLADHNPERPGLEVFQIHEGTGYGWDLHDAANGEILFNAPGGRDNGRGIAAQMSANHRCSFFASNNDPHPRSAATGNIASDIYPPLNYRIFWDGDLQEELLSGTSIDKWTSSGMNHILLNGKNFSDYDNSGSINGTKATPCLQADLFGDWREELFYINRENLSCINVFSTNVQTDYRVPTLMHDHTYRMGICWQNVGYNQPPHIGYFLPDLFMPNIEFDNDEMAEQTVTLGDSIMPVTINIFNTNTTALHVDSTFFPTGEISGLLPEFKTSRNPKMKTLTLLGKPSDEGDYTILFSLKTTTMYPKKTSVRVVVHVTNPTGIQCLENTGLTKTTEHVYDLSGRRVTDLRHGPELPNRQIYIIGGKKYTW